MPSPIPGPGTTRQRLPAGVHTRAGRGHADKQVSSGRTRVGLPPWSSHKRVNSESPNVSSSSLPEWLFLCLVSTSIYPVTKATAWESTWIAPSHSLHPAFPLQCLFNNLLPIPTAPDGPHFSFLLPFDTPSCSSSGPVLRVILLKHTHHGAPAEEPAKASVSGSSSTPHHGPDPLRANFHVLSPTTHFLCHQPAHWVLVIPHADGSGSCHFLCLEWSPAHPSRRGLEKSHPSAV